MPNFKERYEALLKKRQERRDQELNAPIFIRDLILTTPKARSTGEAGAHTNIYGQKSPLIRLADHIEFLCNLANEEHRAHNCEMTESGDYQLTEDKQNHITRLLMSEFSLYGERPLRIEEFEALTSKILTFNLDPNVHVLLSSFGVRDKSGNIINMILYLEGGNPIKPHLFTKNTAYSIDIDYGQSDKIFSQQKRGRMVTFHAEASVPVTGEGTIAMAGIFECSTAGNAQFTQVIDVCSDHTSAHARALSVRRLRKEIPAELLPEQVEHCITSNSVTQRENQSVSDCVIQADPMVSVHAATGLRLGQGTLTEETKKRLKFHDTYIPLEIIPSETGYEIKNPIFGSDCNIEILEERPAAQYLPVLQRELVAHNERFKEQETEKIMASNPRTSLR